MAKQHKKDPIPENVSREELAKFWDTHSLADYWDGLKPIEVVFDLKKPKEEKLVLRVQKGVKERVEALARRKGLNASALVRMWLMEKLQTHSL